MENSKPLWKKFNPTQVGFARLGVFFRLVLLWLLPTLPCTKAEHGIDLDAVVVTPFKGKLALI